MGIRQVAAQRAHGKGPSLTIPKGSQVMVRSAPSPIGKSVENHVKGPQGGKRRGKG